MKHVIKPFSMEGFIFAPSLDNNVSQGHIKPN